MRLVSYNMRQGGLRRPENPWLRVINTVGADIVCAQETVHPEQFSSETLTACGGHFHKSVAHGKWGSAIAYRERPAQVIEVPGFEGWVVGAKIAPAGLLGEWSGVNVFSVHIPSPGPYEPRVDQLIDALAAIKDDDPMIVAGPSHTAHAGKA
jgi:exonuclease III